MESGAPDLVAALQDDVLRGIQETVSKFSSSEITLSQGWKQGPRRGAKTRG